MFVLAMVIACTQTALAKAPNVLYIVADDLRPDAIGRYGHADISTPTLDSLADKGFSFSNAYNFGSNVSAICQPSRAMFLTGCTLWHIDTKNLDGATTMPEVFRNAGYSTFGTGKWHNGQPSFTRSFVKGNCVFFGGCTECSETSNSANEKAKSAVYRTTVYQLNPDGSFETITPAQHGNLHASTLFANATIDFIRNHTATSTAPFFAYLALTAAHDPRTSPEPYRSMYRDQSGESTVRLPKNFQPQLGFDQGDSTIRDEMLLSTLRDPQAVREELADYYGMISHMDHEIGRVLEALNETSAKNNTIIVFHGDQGLAIGSHGLLGKQNPYEESIKAPMIVAGPGIAHGSSTALVYLHDVFPTIAAMAGIRIPGHVDGKDLTGIITGSATDVRKALFNSYKNHQKVIRQGTYKLIYFPHLNKIQLFDLANDPLELDDLSANSDKIPVAEKLAKLMRREQLRVGDPDPVPMSMIGASPDAPDKAD